MTSIVLLLAVAAQEAPEPRWKLAPGDVLVYEHTIEQTVRMKSGGAEYAYVQRTDVVERLAVEHVTAEGRYVVHQTLPSVRTAVDGEVVLDRRKDPRPPREYLVTPEGLVTERGGAEVREWFQQQFSATGAEPEEAGDAFGPMALTLVPPRPRDAGPEWSDVEEAGHAGTGCRIVATTTCRNEAPAGGGHVVGGSMALRLEDAPAGLRLSEGTGRLRGVFDAAGGALREGELEFRMGVENRNGGEAVTVASGTKIVTRLKERTRR